MTTYGTGWTNRITPTVRFSFHAVCTGIREYVGNAYCGGLVLRARQGMMQQDVRAQASKHFCASRGLCLVLCVIVSTVSSSMQVCSAQAIVSDIQAIAHPLDPGGHPVFHLVLSCKGPAWHRNACNEHLLQQMRVRVCCECVCVSALSEISSLCLHCHVMLVQHALLLTARLNTITMVEA